jgi:hypothetical protein
MFVDFSKIYINVIIQFSRELNAEAKVSLSYSYYEI